MKIAPNKGINQYRSLNIDMEDSKRRATLPEGRIKRNEDSSVLVDSADRRESLDHSVPLPE